MKFFFVSPSNDQTSNGDTDGQKIENEVVSKFKLDFGTVSNLKEDMVHDPRTSTDEIEALFRWLRGGAIFRPRRNGNLLVVAHEAPDPTRLQTTNNR